jgi:predicted alpha/beta hydrolase family esterase
VLSLSSSRNSTTVRSETAIRLTRAALQTAFVVSEHLGAGIAQRLFTTPRRHQRPVREQRVLATARPFSIDVALRAPRWHGAHQKVAAWRWGHGPVVLLVHGWEGRGSQLGAFVEPLVDAGLSVVTFDAPAHGDSAGSQLYLTDHADCIVDVVAAIGPVHAIVAHSFGAAAVLLAQSRGGVDAPRNVMIAPNVVIDDAVRRFAKVVALDDRDRSTLEDQLAQQSGVGVESLRLDRLIGTRSSQLLVVHDKADPEVPFDHGQRLALLWPDARLLATHDLGHRRVLRDPAVIDAVVAAVREGLQPPASDLVREVDRCLDGRA